MNTIATTSATITTTTTTTIKALNWGPIIIAKLNSQQVNDKAHHNATNKPKGTVFLLQFDNEKKQKYQSEKNFTDNSVRIYYYPVDASSITSTLKIYPKNV